MENYTVITVSDKERDQVEQHFRWHDTHGDGQTCAHCGTGSYNKAVCWSCRKACQHQQSVAGYIYQANGTQMAFRRCWHCGSMTGEGIGAVPRGGTIHDVCLRDNRSTQPCQRCTATVGTEYHHWAPRNTFPDADQWPGAWLCRSCHRLWHRTMDGYRWHARAATA